MNCGRTPPGNNHQSQEQEGRQRRPGCLADPQFARVWGGAVGPQDRDLRHRRPRPQAVAACCQLIPVATWRRSRFTAICQVLPPPAVRPYRLHGRKSGRVAGGPGVATWARGRRGLRSCTRLCKASHSAILPRFAASNHEGEIQWRQSTGLAATGSSSAATPRLLPVESVAFWNRWKPRHRRTANSGQAMAGPVSMVSPGTSPRGRKPKPISLSTGTRWNDWATAPTSPDCRSATRSPPRGRPPPGRDPAGAPSPPRVPAVRPCRVHGRK